MKTFVLAFVMLFPCLAQAKVHTLQVTIGAGTTPLIASGDLFFKWIVFQNNAAATMRIGDSLTTSSRGIQLLAGGSYTQQPFATPTTGNLSGWYVAGTQGQVIDIIYDDGGN